MTLGETMYVASRLVWLNVKTEPDAVHLIQDALAFGYEPIEIEYLEDIIALVFEHIHNQPDVAAQFKHGKILPRHLNTITHLDEKTKLELYSLIRKFNKTKSGRQDLLFQAINTVVLEFII